MNEVGQALSQDVNAVVTYLPRVGGAIVIFIIGYIVALLVGRTVEFVLKEVGVDRLGESTGLADTLTMVGLPPRPSRLLGRLAYAIVLVATLVQTVDAIGLDQLSLALRELLLFVPHIVLAVLILLGGAIVGDLLGRAAAAAVNRANVLYHALIGTLVRILVLVMAVLLAMQQLTIDATFLLDVLSSWGARRGPWPLPSGGERGRRRRIWWPRATWSRTSRWAMPSLSRVSPGPSNASAPPAPSCARRKAAKPLSPIACWRGSWCAPESAPPVERHPVPERATARVALDTDAAATTPRQRSAPRCETTRCGHARIRCLCSVMIKGRHQ